MEFRLLGGVEAGADGRLLDLGPRKQRLVLGLLAWDVNRTVPVDRLVDLTWPADPPRTASHAVRVSVSRLRALLAGAGAARYGVELATQGPGYLLRADPMSIDVHRFRDLLARARAADQPGVRLRLLDEAMALWPGGPLVGIAPEETRDRLCGGLEEARLIAVEDRFDALLELGRHREVLDSLAEESRRYPSRERLVGQLMLALYRSGRQVDALNEYRDLRNRLAEELGIDPGPELSRLHQAILRADPSLSGAGTREGSGAGALPNPGALPIAGAPPSAGATGEQDQPSTPAPAQLPPDTGSFVGRDRELGTLDEMLAGDPVALIVGTAGAGKTTLAVHWAQAARSRFPDGQLYVNLRGWSPGEPMRPIGALARFLRALGVPADQVPLDEDEAATAYRMILADRRVLVVLDNARSAAQVRPLLPAGPGSRVLVTSRDRLGGLVAREGARRLALDMLSPDGARTLLETVVGADRVRAEPAAAGELGRLCVHLPLALRIAAANLTNHPSRPIADYVAELGGDERLSALSVDDDPEAAVRTAFDLSVAALAPATGRLFRMLGLVPGSDVTAAGAAALLGTTPERVRRMLDQLASAHLADEQVPGRFGMHDLLRHYARDLCEQTDAERDRHAALARLSDFYRRGTDAAARLLYPQMQRLPADAGDAPDPAADPLATPAGEGPGGDWFVEPEHAMEWLETERPNLVAIVTHAAAADRALPVAWQLADNMRGYFWMRRHATDWLTVGEAALAAARIRGNSHGQAAAHLCLAQADRWCGRQREAVDHYRAAVTEARRCGWQQGEAAALGTLGNVYRDQGRMAESARYHDQARLIYQRTGGLGGEAVGLSNLGNVLVESGRVREAIDHLNRALMLYEKIGAQNGQGHVLNSLGCAYHWLGRLDTSREYLESALALHRRMGSREGEADTMNNIAEVYCDAGRHRKALEYARASAVLAEQANDLRVLAEAHNTLATVQLRTRHPAQALDHYREAYRLAHQIGWLHAEVPALCGLALIHCGLERHADAFADATRAVTLARGAGLRILEADARTALARIHLAAGRPYRAAAQARGALVLHRSAGRRLGEIRTRYLLAQVRPLGALPRPRSVDRPVPRRRWVASGGRT